MKYQVLQDWNSEGYSLEKEKFETVHEAVVHALKGNYGHTFLIVQVIDWRAVEDENIWRQNSGNGYGYGS